MCVAVVLQAFTSVAFLGEDAVVGTSGGQLYRFQDRSLIQVVQAHGLNEPVLSLVGMGAERRQVMSGGRDGLIGTWDAQLKPLGSPLDLTASNVTERSREGGVGGDMAVVAVHALGREGYVVAGTRGGQVIELQTTQQGGLQARLLINAHAAGELWGLDTHPSKSEYATAGEGESRSRTIIEHRGWRIGDSRIRDGLGGNRGSCAWRPGAASRLSAEFASSQGQIRPSITDLTLSGPPCSDLLVRGCADKTVRTWSIRRLSQLSIRALPHPARAVAYSPCGRHIAVGPSIFNSIHYIMHIYQGAQTLHSSRLLCVPCLTPLCLCMLCQA